MLRHLSFLAAFCLSFAIFVAPAAADDWANCTQTADPNVRKNACSAVIANAKITDGRRASAYYNLGRACQDLRVHDRAIDAYSRVIELKPDYPEAYNGRGLSYKSRGKYAEAIADFSRAIELKKDFAEAWNNRGDTYFNQGIYTRVSEDYGRAVADYSQAIALNAGDWSAHARRGDVYRTKSDYSRAIADYSSATALKPDYAYAYNGRGLSYYSQRNTASQLQTKTAQSSSIRTTRRPTPTVVTVLAPKASMTGRLRTMAGPSS